MISIWGTGTDNVDLAAARDLGITVTNTPGANALSVAEHTLAILLSLSRQIPRLDREVRSGKWPRLEMVQLSGKVLGLLGLGAIGRHMARMAKGLGMDVTAWVCFTMCWNSILGKSCKSWLNMLQKLFIGGPPLCVMGFPGRNPPSRYKTRTFSFSKLILDKNDLLCFSISSGCGGDMA